MKANYFNVNYKIKKDSTGSAWASLLTTTLYSTRLAMTLVKFPSLPTTAHIPSALLKSSFLLFSSGKKCTYGIKCKFHHPERAKQSNHSVADELRQNAKHPSTAPKQSLAHASPVPGKSLLLVEDMAKKLTLGRESASLKIKKDHKNEHLTQVKASHRSGRRATSRKEKTSQHLSSSDHSSVRQSGSQELDSGLGSIDSQPMEAPWIDHQYGVTYGSSQHTPGVKQQYCPPRSAPCSCCSHGPSSQGTTPAFQHRYSLGSASSHGSDEIPFSPPHYPSYGAYSVSMHAYSQLTDYQQQQKYRSAPFGAHPPAVRSLPGERSCWKPPQGTHQNPSGGEEREAVRKKLLAIFNAHLVDTAMDMFPQLMDPQMLAAEILMLQSQDR